jgi:hypothetical protein
MPVITGNAYTVADGPLTALDQITVQLCGYGSQVPRINGVGLFTGLETSNLPIDGITGEFTVSLFANDLIVPAGTYYTFTFANENGDVVQVNAYRFIGDTSVDLNLINPYDPNQPPPPLPPLITNLLLVVPWSPTPEFPGDQLATFRIVLTGDVTSSTAPDTVQGNLYTFIIIQDAVGGHVFTWPPNFLNASPVNPDPNGLTVQTFVMGLSNLVSIGAATWWSG